MSIKEEIRVKNIIKEEIEKTMLILLINSPFEKTIKVTIDK